MQSDVVEVPKLSVIHRVWWTFLVLLLDRDDLFHWISASEQYAITWIKPKEVDGLQGVNHSVHTRAIDDTSLLTRAQTEDLHSRFVETDEVFVCVQQDTVTFGLPKLETLMVEDHWRAVIIVRDIHNNHIIGVDEDRFVTDDQFFKLRILSMTTQDCDVTVSDIKLVFPLDKEIWLLRRILFFELKDEESEFLLELIEK